MEVQIFNFFNPNLFDKLIKFQKYHDERQEFIKYYRMKYGDEASEAVVERKWKDYHEFHSDHVGKAFRKIFKHSFIPREGTLKSIGRR